MKEERASPLVLLVEDFADTRWMMRRLLEMSGCRVVEASDGREAIERASEERPDLVLMDLNMPVLDGFAAALRLREREETRDVPIIAVTAYDTAESRAAARAVGCTDYIAKPVDFDKLLSIVAQRLDIARAQEQATAG